MVVSAKPHPVHPACDVACHDPLATYSLYFYRNLVGESAMWLYVDLVFVVRYALGDHPNCQSTSQVHFGGPRASAATDREDVPAHELAKLVDSGMVELESGRCLVAMRLPTLDAASEAKLPRRLRSPHAFLRRHIEQACDFALETGIERPWVKDPTGALARAQKEARNAAKRLLSQGLNLPAVETQLAHLGVHPCLMSSTARWALWSLTLGGEPPFPYANRPIPPMPKSWGVPPRRNARESDVGCAEQLADVSIDIHGRNQVGLRPIGGATCRSHSDSGHGSSRGH